MTFWSYYMSYSDVTFLENKSPNIFPTSITFLPSPCCTIRRFKRNFKRVFKRSNAVTSSPAPSRLKRVARRRRRQRRRRRWRRVKKLAEKNEVGDSIFYSQNCWRIEAAFFKSRGQCDWLLWPDWAIFGNSWKQILLQKWPKYFENYSGFWKTWLKVKTILGTGKLGYFLFNHLVKLVVAQFIYHQRYWKDWYSRKRGLGIDQFLRNIVFVSKMKVF